MRGPGVTVGTGANVVLFKRGKYVWSRFFKIETPENEEEELNKVAVAHCAAYRTRKIADEALQILLNNSSVLPPKAIEQVIGWCRELAKFNLAKPVTNRRIAKQSQKTP